MVDITTKLPLVARKNVILVISDRLSKMIYFIATTEGTLAEELEQLFRDNVWMLHRLPESMISDRGPQFAVELIKELNRILGIETKLLISFYLQTDRQTEQINQKLEEYLWFFVGHRQKYWPEQLALADFTVNSKVYLTTKVSPFMANYDKELKMVADIRRKD